MVETVLGERYRITARLASGAMGDVFIAVDERLQRTVAVKILKEELAADDRFVERFRREARAAGSLSHPNIARVFDYDEDGAAHFIVMELAPGRDLGRLLRDEGSLEPARSAAIAAQVADALSHAHAAGLIHRDVKPHNVIVSEDDRIKVTDFGIARAIGESALTGTGAVLGTAHYLSPEQAGGEPATPASDIYSLGIVLFEMLTGTVPFRGETPVSVATQHLHEDVPRPSTLKAGVPAALDDVVATATRRDPAARFPSAEAMASALRADGDAAAATTVVAAASTWPFAAPSRYDAARLGRIVLVAFGILLALAVGALAFRLASAGNDAGTTRQRHHARSTAPAQVRPDDYTGMKVDDAVAEVTGIGLTPSVVGDGDVVASQNPAPETDVPKGDTVTLYTAAPEKPKPPKDKGGPGNPHKIPPGHQKHDD
ncbi:MAG TPA: protein kinase [Actinomycetota bacterium]|nr:protein kinase [Actinomycetota bacterium]